MMKNKGLMAVQLALKFVEEHKEQFEAWVKKLKEEGKL